MKFRINQANSIKPCWDFLDWKSGKSALVNCYITCTIHISLTTAFLTEQRKVWRATLGLSLPSKKPVSLKCHRTPMSDKNPLGCEYHTAASSFLMLSFNFHSHFSHIYTTSMIHCFITDDHMLSILTKHKVPILSTIVRNS